MKTGNFPTVNKVYNLILLDESGSMEAIRQPTINGFNELLQSIRHSLHQHPEVAQWVSLYSFNGGGITEHLPLVPAARLEAISPEQYRPDNTTPLYDAIGLAVSRLRKETDRETNFKVIVTIFTDGEENSSTEYSFDATVALINQCKMDGWLFAYVGANHDVEKTAKTLKIDNYLKYEASAAGTGKMFKDNIRARNSFMSRLKTGDDLSSNYFGE